MFQPLAEAIVTVCAAVDPVRLECHNWVCLHVLTKGTCAGERWIAAKVEG